MSPLQLCMPEMHCIAVAGSQSVTGMAAMFSQVKFSGQSPCIFDELRFLPRYCGSSSEFLNKADVSVVMNDCNQFNSFFFFFFYPKVQPNFVWNISNVAASLLPLKKNWNEKKNITTLEADALRMCAVWPRMSTGNRSSSHLGRNPAQRAVRTGAKILR